MFLACRCCLTLHRLRMGIDSSISRSYLSPDAIIPVAIYALTVRCRLTFCTNWFNQVFHLFHTPPSVRHQSRLHFSGHSLSQQAAGFYVTPINPRMIVLPHESAVCITVGRFLKSAGPILKFRRELAGAG
jgi:hypothetical protein